MIVRVTDTHALLWYLSDNPRLSEAALACFAEAEAGRAAILVPSIVLVEAVYLFEKQRIPQELIDGILIRIGEGPSYQLVPLDLSVVHALRSIDRTVVPDMPDRIIAATALACRAPLISRDGKLRIQAIETVW